MSYHPIHGVDVWKGGANPYRWFVSQSSSNAQDREQLIAEFAHLRSLMSGG